MNMSKRTVVEHLVEIYHKINTKDAEGKLFFLTNQDNN